MTVLELAERDYAKAHRNHQFASLKPNVPVSELERTLELVALRKQILEIVRRTVDE